jgi:tRNA threonylcarbamoyl adenosine modification protein YjeE
MLFHVSLDRLPNFAKWFWENAGAVKVFAFHGPMGAGKTTLITALGRYRGVKGSMSSPTFSIINQYVFEEGGQEKLMYHIDLYRLDRADEALQAGVESRNPPAPRAWCGWNCQIVVLCKAKVKSSYELLAASCEFCSRAAIEDTFFEMIR